MGAAAKWKGMGVSTGAPLPPAGMADIEKGRAMEEDAIFRLMSMTKPVIALAALTLYDEGRFTLDEPIAKHCPEWAAPRVKEGDAVVPAKAAITPRMLMSHSSGLGYGGGQAAAALAYQAMTKPGATLKNFSEAVAKEPLLFEPGTSYNYGVGRDILGRYLEALTGKPLDVILRERLFGTIGDYERLCRMILNRGVLDGVRVLKPETVDLIFENHLEHPTMKYGLGGIVNGAGSYGWGGADGTQFVVDRKNGSFTLFMVQTQHYKAPTYPAFLALANEACGLVAPGATAGTPSPPAAGGGMAGGGRAGPLAQRDTNKDGKLGPDELPAALFNKLDADKDGFVTEAELQPLWKR